MIIKVVEKSKIRRVLFCSNHPLLSRQMELSENVSEKAKNVLVTSVVSRVSIVSALRCTMVNICFV